MKTRCKISLATLAIVTLAASAALAYDWRQKFSYGNDPTRRSTRTATAYSPWGAEPQVESRRAFSYVPAQFRVGDTIVVVAASAEMKIGDRVVATVPRGHRIVVSGVEGPWVGTHIEKDGRQIGGWILASDVAVGAGPQNVCP